MLGRRTVAPGRPRRVCPSATRRALRRARTRPGGLPIDARRYPAIVRPRRPMAAGDERESTPAFLPGLRELRRILRRTSAPLELELLGRTLLHSALVGAAAG